MPFNRDTYAHNKAAGQQRQPRKKERGARSSYGAIERTKGRVKHPLAPLTHEERLDDAMRRVTDAAKRAAAAPHDRALAVAVEARRNEWLDLKYALARVASTRTASRSRRTK